MSERRLHLEAEALRSHRRRHIPLCRARRREVIMQTLLEGGSIRFPRDTKVMPHSPGPEEGRNTLMLE